LASWTILPEDESNISSMDKNDAAMPPSINDNEAKDADGFQTLSRKHRASVGSVEAVMKMEGVVEMRNPYAALTSLGMTRSRGPSPAKSPTDNHSPQKKKPKVNSTFKARLDEFFAKQAEEVAKGTTLK
jgi:hypothetical protein